MVYLYLDRLRLWFEPFYKRKAPAGLRLQPAALAVLAGLALLGGGCNFAPHYAKPSVPAPATFKEMTPAEAQATDGWKTAEPKDDAVRGRWWEMFGNPNLNALEEQVAISNQTVAVALENFLSARAVAKQNWSRLFPTAGVNPGVTRARTATGGPAGARRTHRNIRCRLTPRGSRIFGAASATPTGQASIQPRRRWRTWRTRG